MAFADPGLVALGAIFLASAAAQPGVSVQTIVAEGVKAGIDFGPVFRGIFIAGAVASFIGAFLYLTPWPLLAALVVSPLAGIMVNTVDPLATAHRQAHPRPRGKRGTECLPRRHRIQRSLEIAQCRERGGGPRISRGQPWRRIT